MKTSERRKREIERLFRDADGKCSICGCETLRDAKQNHPRRAVRFRTGSSYGAPGRFRPRVLACRQCAQERSDQITASIDIDELRHRSGRHQTEFYELAAPDSSGVRALEGTEPADV